MAARDRNGCRGITLVEVVVAGSIIIIGALGALSYEYHAAGQARMAKAETAAVQIAYFLLQDWKAHGGSEHYRLSGPVGLNNPEDSSTNFVEISPGVYGITVDNIPMCVELSRRVGPDGNPAVISITVTTWCWLDFTEEAIRSHDPSLVLTTYARVDQSGG